MRDPPRAIASRGAGGEEERMGNCLVADEPLFGRRAARCGSAALIASAAAAILLGLAAPGAAFAQDEGCTKVTTQSLAIPGLVIEGSKMQEQGGGLPKHCVVTGEVNDR